MPPAAATRATIEGLYAVEGEAELIDARIVTFMPSGSRPGIVAGESFGEPRQHARATGRGVAQGGGGGHAVEGLASGRRSFAPDASFHVGPPPGNRLRFVQGAPAVEGWRLAADAIFG